MTRNPDDDFDFRQQVCAWLNANGIDPAHTPMEPNASIADGQLTLLQKVQRNGRDVVSGGDALKETVTVPLLVEPSPDIAEWLRPRCPNCGR
jgi:hypothetical protein